MAKSIFDKQPLTIPCPQCGHETTMKISWLKTHNQYTCGGCSTDIHLNTDELLGKLGKADKQIAGLSRNITLNL